MKRRYPTITKLVYTKLLREVKQMYKEIDCPVKIYHKPIIWRRYGSETANFGEYQGYYDIEKKRVMAVFFGKIGRAKQLELLLHEYRHAIHHRKKLYKDYYYGSWRKVFFDKKFIPRKKPDLRNALLAEMDCNRFAYYWLKSKGVEIPKDFSYNLNTNAQTAEMLIEERKNEKK